MKDLTMLAQEIIDDSTMEGMTDDLLFKGLKAADIYPAAYGFISADLYNLFDDSGKVAELSSKLTEGLTDEESDKVFDVFRRAFTEGYKAGFACRDKMCRHIGIVKEVEDE